MEETATQGRAQGEESHPRARKRVRRAGGVRGSRAREGGRRHPAANLVRIFLYVVTRRINDA